MADTLTTTAQVDPAVKTTYDRVLLTRAMPALLHEQFAQVRNLNKKSGNTIKFRRYTNLSTATTPLAEGVTPPGQLLSKTDLTATISHYGDFVHVTDVVDLTVEDAELVESNELLGQQMGETRDEIIRDVLAATASVTDAAGGSNGNTPTEITKSDIDGVVLTLLGDNAKMMRPQVTASTGVGTAPVRAAFWGITKTDLLDDLEDVTGFTAVAEYPNSGAAMEDEWGSTGNVRWLQSSVAHVNETPTPDEYKMLILGQKAYAKTDIEGATESITKPFGSGDDPLNQRATSGWKMSMVARILNDTFMHALNVTHS